MRTLYILVWVISFAIICNILRFAAMNYGFATTPLLSMSLILEVVIDVLVGRSIWRNTSIPRFDLHYTHHK